ncbi:hypothetical protein BOX15_Mlig023578g1, partial [Macrostomum lignano]
QRQVSGQHSSRSRALQASGGSAGGGRSGHRSPSLSDREDMLLDSSNSGGAGGGGDFSHDSAALVKDRRRELHTQAEQKRRDAIKQGYDKLYELVGAAPSASAAGGAAAAGGGSGETNAKSLSKASILQRSIRHMEHLAKQKELQERELDKLHKEVMALKIMKMNYEHFVSSAGASGGAAAASSPQSQPLPEQVKFSVFQSVMDQLFAGFDRSTSAGSFAELSGCVITWLEEQCRPQTVHELSVQALQQVLTQYSQQQQGRQAPGNRL